MEALKARGLHYAPVAVTSNFTVQAPGPFTVLGGWASVDATVGGHTVRFVTTHLDPLSGTVRTAQAAQLAQGPLSTGLPAVLTGDRNAGPASATYAVLRQAGLTDSWLRAQAGGSGFTLLPGPGPAERHLHARLQDRLCLQPRRRAGRR